MSYQDDAIVDSAIQDFFRSANGVNRADGLTDYTEAISHNGFLSLNQDQDPISPLDFGLTVRNDIIRMWDNNQTNANQFFGLGISNQALRSTVFGLSDSHLFMAGTSPTTAKQYVRMLDRVTTFGDPAAPVGEGHWTLSTPGDDGALRFRSPDAAVGANKVQFEIAVNGYSGNGGLSGSGVEFRTATNVANSVPQSRLVLTETGDVMISAAGTPYNAGSSSSALLTVNGAIRVKSGVIQPGGTIRQVGGIVFAAGTDIGGVTNGQETDGGITSTGDDNLTFYTNGSLRMVIQGGNVSKPGGGLFGATSDIRTKRDVKPHSSNYAETLALEPIEYFYNGEGGTVDNGKRHVGFSAQAVQQLFPHWVSQSKETIAGTPVLQIDTSNLVIELLHVVKMQAQLIDSLNDRIAALEAPKAKTIARK